MDIEQKTNFFHSTSEWRHLFKIVVVLILVLIFGACTTNLQTKVAGNLNQLSDHQTVAILPVEIMEKGQKETAAIFRQGLYANLKQSKFNLLERYVVDSLLKQHNLTNPAQFIKMNPMEFAEILGVDAVLITRINKVERSYFVVHSSIEIGISAQMVDTRSGEILWRAEQTESDFQGIGKIPTGISAAVLGPIQFVTNKLNLHRMTSKLVNKLTAIVKNPEDAREGETFEEPLIASATTRDLKKIENVHDLEAKWAEDVAAYTEVPSSLNDMTDDIGDIKKDPSRHFENNLKKDIDRPEIMQSMPESKEENPSHINWTPRDPNLKPISRSEGITTEELDSIAASRGGIDVEKLVIPVVNGVRQTALPQYTIQVGAYETKINAVHMADDLSGKGYDTFVTPYLDGNVTLFKVHVEKFSNKKQASEFANKFSSKESLTTFITTINPS